MSLNICITTTKHEEQRYPTVGDYFTDKEGVRQFRISDMNNPDYEFLVALHELIESHLCQKRGIADESIDTFDQNFRGFGEPGDAPDAPYYKEHQFATGIERIVAHELGVDWNVYDEAVDSL